MIEENCVCLRYFLMPYIQKLFEDNHLVLDDIKYETNLIRTAMESSVALHVRLDTFLCYISNARNRAKTLDLVSDIYKLISNKLANVNNMFIIVGINKNNHKTDILLGTINDEKDIHNLIKDCNRYYVKYESNLDSMYVSEFS